MGCALWPLFYSQSPAGAAHINNSRRSPAGAPVRDAQKKPLPVTHIMMHVKRENELLSLSLSFQQVLLWRWIIESRPTSRRRFSQRLADCWAHPFRSLFLFKKLPPVSVSFLAQAANCWNIHLPPAAKNISLGPWFVSLFLLGVAFEIYLINLFWVGRLE